MRLPKIKIEIDEDAKDFLYPILEFFVFCVLFTLLCFVH